MMVPELKDNGFSYIFDGPHLSRSSTSSPPSRSSSFGRLRKRLLLRVDKGAVCGQDARGGWGPWPWGWQ